MDKIYEFFNGNPWLNILFLILTLIGIFLSFYFYFKSLKTKNPVYAAETTNLINSKISTIQNIEIKYRDTILKNLSITKLAFWNSGNESIRREDIAKQKPLQIISKENIQIYDFDLINANAVNNVILNQLDQNRINISFDFLDYQDGFIVNIYHSGKSKDINIEGKLIGANNIGYGIKGEVLLSKLDFISIPVDYCSDKDGIGYKILTLILGFLTVLVVLPFFLLLAPIDYIKDRFAKRRIPKDFQIHD
jgi:hypothetical protein